MKPLNGVLAIVTVAILAAPSLAGATAATFKRITPGQKVQLSAKLKAPGLQPVKRPALPSTATATAACELTFRQDIKAYEEAVSRCQSLDRPSQNSPIYIYNNSTPSQQFALCQGWGYADEFACFNDHLIRAQQRYCTDFNYGMWELAERKRADCLAK